MCLTTSRWSDIANCSVNIMQLPHENALEIRNECFSVTGWVYRFLGSTWLQATTDFAFSRLEQVPSEPGISAQSQDHNSDCVAPPTSTNVASKTLTNEWLLIERKYCTRSSHFGRETGAPPRTVNTRQIFVSKGRVRLGLWQNTQLLSVVSWHIAGDGQYS